MHRLLPLVLLCGLVSPLLAADPKPAKTDRAALEKEFAEKLSGATLVGTFTTDGKEGAKPDRYKIVSAEKVSETAWVITATMKVGGEDVNIPMSIPVFWADDTPVLSLTNMTIPGVGTFTSRVMFYGDRYAGTWQHGDHGGTFAGLIEKAKPKEKK